MNQYSTTQLIGELVKRLETEGPQDDFVITNLTPKQRAAFDARTERAFADSDDLAGLPTDDAALAFVSAISMGGTGEFAPVQDHELDTEDYVEPCDMPVTTYVVTEAPTDDPAIVTLYGVMRLNPGHEMTQAEAEIHCYRDDVPDQIERMRAWLAEMIMEAAADA